jgi:cytochrome c6
MKTILILLSMAVVGFSSANSALAADAEAGEKIFLSNCAGCHNNGMNVMVPEKTLKKSALEKNGKYSEKAIISQVTNGKSPMPAFGKVLSASDIENVAAFVMKQANSDWK